MKKLNTIMLLSALVSSSASLADMGKMTHENHKKAAHGQKGAKIFDAGMKPVLTEYIKIHKELMNNAPDLNKIIDLSKKISSLSQQLDLGSVKGEHSGHYGSVPANLKISADTLSKAKDLMQVRNSFKKLSQPMAMWTGMAKPEGFSVMYCPMVKASWVQKNGETQNPYDSKMPRCGSKV